MQCFLYIYLFIYRRTEAQWSGVISSVLHLFLAHCSSNACVTRVPVRCVSDLGRVQHLAAGFEGATAAGRGGQAARRGNKAASLIPLIAGELRYRCSSAAPAITLKPRLGFLHTCFLLGFMFWLLVETVSCGGRSGKLHAGTSNFSHKATSRDADSCCKLAAWNPLFNFTLKFSTFSVS